MQTIVPVSDSIPLTPAGVTGVASLTGGSEAWECLDALGDTAFVQIDAVTNSEGAGGIFSVNLDVSIDPGFDDGYLLRIRGQYFFNETGGMTYYIALNANGTLIKEMFGNSADGTPSGELAALFSSGVFVEIEIGLSEAEVQAFRDNDGFNNASILVFASTTKDPIGGATVQSFSKLSYFALEIPGSNPDVDLELVQSGGYEISGSGADYLVQSGGYEVSGGGSDYYWWNEITQSGGYEISGGGEYGSNEIVQSGGYIVSGGGRDGYFVAPDISGIYVLVPNKRHDTYYDRNSDIPAATVDFKIPDPFVSLAFLPKD